MSMDANTQQDQAVEFVEKAGHAMAAADQILTEVHQEKSAAAQQAEAAVSEMVAGRFITDSERGEFLQKVSTHDGALELLRNVLKFAAGREAAYQQKLAVAGGGGEQVPEKQAMAQGAGADANFSRPVITGSKAGLGEKRASDDPLRRLAGLT